MNIRRKMQALAGLAVIGLLAIPSPAHAASTGVSLKTDLSGFCAVTEGGVSTNSARIILGNCPSGADLNGAYNFTTETGGAVRIKSRANGKCLNVQGGSTSNSARIIQFTCGAGDLTLNDQWYVNILSEHGTSPLVQIKNVNSGKCLNVQGGVGSYGTPIVQFTCQTENHLDWFQINRL